VAARVIWLNGPFGVGKTATADALCSLRSDLRIFDPEQVGFMLRANLKDQSIGDFQDWAAWRRLVPATAQELISQTGQSLVAPQTVLSEDYWREITAPLEHANIEIVHVLLDCAADILVERISTTEEAVKWRLNHVEQYQEAAETWLRVHADMVVEVTATSAHDAARVIAASL
jgi:hypothetical protein